MENDNWYRLGFYRGRQIKVCRSQRHPNSLTRSLDVIAEWNPSIKEVRAKFMKATEALMLLCLPGLIRSFSLLRFSPVSRFYKLPHKTSVSLTSRSQAISAASTTNFADKMNNSLSEIFLTVEEEELFTTLQKVVVDESLGTTVRVAGW